MKDGYARNFLIPNGIAYPATEGNMRALEEEKTAGLRGAPTRRRRAASSSPPNWRRVSLTIKMKVGEDEKLFGSVTAQMIADALKEKGSTIDKRIIDLEEPIKALGIYTVNVKLHQRSPAK